MTAFRIKLQGLNVVDTSSLKSMLKLSADLLSHQWEISDSAEAELTIFALDNEIGQQAWQQHDGGITALLTTSGNITEAVDIVLKKPLRSSNFSNAINLVADRLSQQQATVTSEQRSLASSRSNNKVSADSPSLLSNLSSRWRSKVHQQQPPPVSDLFLFLPELIESAADTITSTEELKSWLEQLPAKPAQRNTTLIAQITAFNRKKLTAKTRLPLLEIYFKAIREFFFEHDSDTAKHDLYWSNDQLKAISTFSLILEELAIGYKLVIRDTLPTLKSLSAQSPELLAITRATEILSLHILHAYQHYHPAPRGDLYQLHQFFLYLEKHGHLHHTVETKESYLTTSFAQLYSQLLLTGIADTYALRRVNIPRIYKLMQKFADNVELAPVSDQHINLSRDFLLTGHFCIDCDQDKIPLAMSKTEVVVRAARHSRLFNLQPVLLELEALFKKVASSTSLLDMDLDIQLLKKIAPKLNTTYERRFHRLPSVKGRSIKLAVGLTATHQAMTNGETTECYQWSISNQGSAGMMISRITDSGYLLNVHDLASIFEQDLPVRIATVRWLIIDLNGMTHAGLEINNGQQPVAVSYTVEGKAATHPALIIQSVDPATPSIMMAEKGVFSAKRPLRINDAEQPFTLIADKIIDATLNYEKFSYNSPATVHK